MKSDRYEIGWYFAYGSNMNPARMRARGIAFEQCAAGTLSGFQLCFNKRASGKHNVAYANIAYARHARVEGVLYQLKCPEDISLMDPFEGNPVRYGREVYTVATAGGGINAWVYIANRALLATGLLPERRYLNHLLAGREFHSAGYHRWLQNQPCLESEVAADSDIEGLKYNV